MRELTPMSPEPHRCRRSMRQILRRLMLFLLLSGGSLGGWIDPDTPGELKRYEMNSNLFIAMHDMLF